MIVKLEKESLQEEKLGNKGKFLLQMKKQGFNVPGGFILDSDVYDEVITSNGIADKIQSDLSELTSENAREISGRITGLFEGALIPEKILQEINMLARDDVFYAVRSSGSKEDLAEYSFAGQYETFLNIKKAQGKNTCMLQIDVQRSTSPVCGRKKYRSCFNEDVRCRTGNGRCDLQWYLLYHRSCKRK